MKSDITEKQDKFLKVLKGNAEKEHVEFVYYYAKNMFEYYNTAFVNDTNVATIDIDIQMSDLGDELFDMAYATEKALYGTTDYVNDHMRMEAVGPMSMEDDDGQVYDEEKDRYVFKNIGSNAAKMKFHWDIYFDKFK